MIEVLRLTAEVQTLQTQLAFWKEKAENSVSLEEYNAKEAQCESLESQVENLKEANRKDREQHEAEFAEKDAIIASRDKEIADKDKQLAEKDAKLKDYQEVEATLRNDNVDLKTLMEFWRGRNFGASSESMVKIMDDVAGPLPTNKHSLMADAFSFIERHRHANWVTSDEKDSGKKTASNKKTNNTKSSRHRKGGNHKTQKCSEVRQKYGPDYSDMPKGYKTIIRKGKPEVWVIEILFMQRAKSYSKIYEIARCNVPGEDPKNTKYPDRLFGRVPVDPSFARFYLEMKFVYNMSEGKIIEMLWSMGCRVKQPTLNRWMQIVMLGIKDVLYPAMLNAIKQSHFTHNDETRILVRCEEIKNDKSKDESDKSGNNDTKNKESDNDKPKKYLTKYIHAALSTEANLFLMLYENGSRSHEVQIPLFEDSYIEAFIADRCTIYPALVKALEGRPLIRGACWVHFRRYLLHAYLQDKRLESVVKMLAMLFQAEKLIANTPNITEQQCVRDRQAMCRPLVEAIFERMEAIRAAGSDYGVLANRAADYLLDDREGFTAFLTCGRMKIENNAIERCFRHIAGGRNNWLQAGSHQSAANIAFMYSLVESCKMNDIDFGEYIETVLKRLQGGATDYSSLLPNTIVLDDASKATSVA